MSEDSALPPATDRDRPAAVAPPEPSRSRADRTMSRPSAPTWTIRVLAVGSSLLVLAALGWLILWLLLRVPLVTIAVASAVLLAALTAPIARRLRQAGAPSSLSALGAVLVVLGALLGMGALVGFRVVSRLRELTGPLAAGIDRVRTWLIEGPLSLNPQDVAGIRDQVVSAVYDAAPSPVAGARMVLFALSALILVVFLVFFMLKDGEGMWAWLLERVPPRRRPKVDGAGRAAWLTLSGYVHGVVVIAVIDAVAIGAGLLLLGVPLWPSLTLLVFLGAFVPLFGATLSGAVAVLITLVTNGPTDAIVVVVIVLAVQQIEGNLLAPLIMGRAVRLHPVVILLSVTVGTVLFGVAGAVVAVPTVAVIYQVIEDLRSGQPFDPVAKNAMPAGPASMEPAEHRG